MCSLFFYCSAASVCAPAESCTKKEWLLTDCKQCCKRGASPVSAFQQRNLCCPHGDNLAQCMIHCNFTKDDVERKDECTVHCQKNCTGGFHFATTTTLTTASTTPTTTIPTTTTPTTTTTTAETTSVPTITSTVSSDFYPVYLSSIKKLFDEKSSDHKACTIRNNHVKGNFLNAWHKHQNMYEKNDQFGTCIFPTNGLYIYIILYFRIKNILYNILGKTHND